jgi:hypothetical protein
VDIKQRLAVMRNNEPHGLVIDGPVLDALARDALIEIERCHKLAADALAEFEKLEQTSAMNGDLTQAGPAALERIATKLGDISDTLSLLDHIADTLDKAYQEGWG